MNKQVASTILNQLGGNKFIVMTGAKNFYTNGNDLCFNIGKNKSKANRIKIVLESNDTYTMTFIKFTKDRITKDFQFIDAKVEVLNEQKNIYCDMLTSVFTNYTGMQTRL